MTHEQTRAMIIEIERRLQTMDPTMQIQNKIETDDIVSFLNQYQNMFIKDVYLSKNKVKDNKRLSSKLNDYLSTLRTTANIYKSIGFSQDTADYEIWFKIPSNYLSYIDSISDINSYIHSTTNPKTQLKVQNKYIDDVSDMYRVINEVYNKNFIMRNPIISDNMYVGNNPINQTMPINANLFTIIHDNYTDINYVRLNYIRMPKPIILDDDSACELPYECFDDLVQGTVDLYVSTKYKLSQPKAKSKQALTNFANLLDEAKKQEDEE